ncbi:hypothetical protein RAB80_010681 [Fusarium oxysporum f. sp. vasinfectum]|nr:hypothetical protein RAB80_010681 [Fusarium oxysporum f. sp. vasinfectum]KAK2929558.1 hypothetical protein FoTM2_009898 [Fusarium oxysporum f. sp. vasinfectum]
MSNNHDNGKQPSKRESRRDKWAMNLAKSDRLEIKGPSEEQLVEANSSSKNASLTVMGQPLYDASIVAMGQRLPTTHVTITIRFPHGDVRLPWFVVGRHPMFAAMFEGGILQWPGASPPSGSNHHSLPTGPRPQLQDGFLRACAP